VCSSDLASQPDGFSVPRPSIIAGARHRIRGVDP